MNQRLITEAASWCETGDPKSWLITNGNFHKKTRKRSKVYLNETHKDRLIYFELHLTHNIGKSIHKRGQKLSILPINGGRHVYVWLIGSCLPPSLITGTIDIRQENSISRRSCEN